MKFSVSHWLLFNVWFDEVEEYRNFRELIYADEHVRVQLTHREIVYMTLDVGEVKR